MFGVEYVAQHVLQTYRQEQKELSYRIYLTDSLRIIGENTAKYAGGSYIKARWADIVDPKPEETQTAEDIIRKIRDKLSCR